MNVIKSTAHIVCCMALVLGMACGGSGGTPVAAGMTITAANAEDAAAAAMAGMDDMFGGTEFVTDALDEGFECVTGSIVITENDVPPVGQANVGDTITLTFNACTDGAGAMINGSMTLRITAFSGDVNNPPVTLGFSVTFNNLTFTEGGDSFTVTGGFTMTMTDNGAGTTTIVMSGTSFAITGMDQGVPINESLTNFRFAVSFNDNTGDYSLDFSGTISDGELGGSVSFDTTTPFQGTAFGQLDLDNPDSGVMVVTGAGGSMVILTVTGPNTIQIQVDEDGDGNFETTINTTWDALD